MFVAFASRGSPVRRAALIAFVVTIALVIYYGVFGGPPQPQPRVFRTGGLSVDSGGSSRSTASGGSLNAPHGGKLVNLIATPERQHELLGEVSTSIPSLTLTQRQLCDIELILSGGFSPLDQFMTKDVYASVVSEMRLGAQYGDAVFPMPITLDFAADTAMGSKIALRDDFFNLIAIFTVEDKWQPDKRIEAEHVFGTTDVSHPAVNYLMNQAGEWYLGGSLEGVRLPQHFDFPELRRTPQEVRQLMQERGWSRFVAFQTRNPMHRAHIELTRLAADRTNAGVLIHPVVGMTKPGDVDYSVRVRCYRAIVESGRYYRKGGVLLSLLPLAMRMAGPREALWHAIIRKNHGATHFVVGRDHAGCKNAQGDDFYGPYDAQDLVNKYKAEIGIEILTFHKLEYLADKDLYLPANEVPEGEKTKSISGTQFRAMMARGDPIPPWFSDPDVIEILREVAPPLHKRGFTVFFTGLSGGGKTTVSMALIERLQSILPTRQMTILDGDVVRTHLSKNLGFSIQDRNTNVARIGYVASEVTRHRGIAICSAIAPFEKGRAASRALVEATGGGFLLVHVSTPAAECARRDVKGLYKKAEEGLIELTGVSHPYENPEQVELMLDGGEVPVEESVRTILGWLVTKGYILPEVIDSYETQEAMVSKGFWTEGDGDPAARLCSPKREGSGMAGNVVLGLGYYKAMGELKQAFAALPDTYVEEVSASSIAAVEQEMLRTKTGTKTARRPESVDVDEYFRTGTPLTAVLSEDDRTEVGFSLLKESAKTRSAQHGDSAPPKRVLLTGARLLVYASTMLRQEPCMRAMVLDVDPARRTEAARKLAEMVGEPAAVEEVGRYLSDYAAAGKQLAETFPKRVQVVQPGKDDLRAVLNSMLK